MIGLQFLPILITGLLVLLDQGTKLWALTDLKPIGSTTLLEGILDLTFVENRGVAFGLFAGKRWLILLMTALIAAGLLYFYRSLPAERKYRQTKASLLLILSGAVGNIIDRVGRGYVVDFFEFTFFEWPVFNVADIFVVGGVILLSIQILFVLKDEDFSKKPKKE